MLVGHKWHLIFKELTNIYEAIGVGLFPNLHSMKTLKKATDFSRTSIQK